MKPTSIETQRRIQQAKENALDEIFLAREKEGREECVYPSYGGPELPIDRVHERYDQMLVELIGKA